MGWASISVSATAAMELERDARRLLEQLDVLRHPSDLDLLIFFARHPRSLLSSDQLAAFLGYGVKDIAASLDLLLEAGFVTRTPYRRHSARMYVLTGSPPDAGWLSAVVQLASTRDGRLALVWEIRRRFEAASTRREREDAGPVLFPRRRRAGGEALRTPNGDGEESEE